MNEMKKIKIFLASSIVEFEREREQLEIFIRNISDQFEEKYNIKIQPILCENIDPVYRKGRKQEEYNQLIRDCDMIFFIFFTKLGQFTYEEFQVAKDHFESFGNPKIYTYFRILDNNQSMDEELASFIYELDKYLGHYYSTFSHIDTIKLRILLSLKIQEMDFIEIKSENGKCVVDDKSVLDLNNVSEFFNNELLQSVKQQLFSIEEEYYSLKTIYVSGDITPELGRRYAEVASKRQNL